MHAWGHNRDWEQCLAKTTVIGVIITACLMLQIALGHRQSMPFYKDLSNFFTKNRAESTPHAHGTRGVPEEILQVPHQRRQHRKTPGHHSLPGAMDVLE